MAKQWAKARKLELSSRPLTENTLNYSATTYPELSSEVKAARTRVLFEYVTHICVEVESRLAFVYSFF